MSELNLPGLPKSYRWKITKGNSPDGYDSVHLKLEKRYIRDWFFGDCWTDERWEYIKLPLSEDIIAAVESAAARIYQEEFIERESNKIVGIYYGDNSD